MSATKFTPGPWNDQHVPNQGVRVVATGPSAPIGQRVAWVPADDTEQLASGRIVERCSREARANARLIAQAPAMYEALKAIHAELTAPGELVGPVLTACKRIGPILAAVEGK